MIRHDDQMRREGNINAIMDGFMSNNPLSKLQSIAGAVNHSVMNDAIKHQIEALIDDPSIVMGFRISQLAIAALSKFKFIRYKGDDPTIIKLIQANKWFE